MEIHIIKNGEYQVKLCGGSKNATKQVLVERNCWFAAKPVGNSFSFCGCTVNFGFDFEDFVIGKREELLMQFPNHEEGIKKFTR
jgi:uncharacterized protein